MTNDPGTPRYNPSLDADTGVAGGGAFGPRVDQMPKGPRLDRRKVVFVLVGIVVLLVAIGGLVWALGGGDPESVEDVADAAVDAAEDFDVDAGIDLFCDPLTKDQRERIDDFISEGREAAGTDEPDVTYEVSDIKGDEEGSFKVTAYSEDGELSTGYIVAEVEVGRDGDRSCVSDIDVEGHEGEPPFDR